MVGKGEFTEEEAGRVFEEVGQVMKACVRDGSDILLRSRDSQIGLALLGVDESGRTAIEKRVAEQIRKHQAATDEQGTLSVLMGSASYPGDGETAAKLLARVRERLNVFVS